MKLLAQLPGKSRRPLATAGAILIYFAAAYILAGRGLLGDFTGRIVSTSTGHDPSVMIWCLAWFPHAIANHLDPFLSRAVWWPVGINLAWITSIPGAAILAWPMTSAFGPVASFNTLSFIALPAAAFTAFLLCRHLTGRNRASIAGGYVFGFSPYFLGHLQNHLLLILAFPIPLAVLLTVRLLEGSLRPRVFAPLMALVLALQIGFSLELFATMTAVGIIALLIGFAVGPEHWRTTVRSVAAPLAASYAIAAVLVAPYWYYLFAFGMPRGSIISPSGVSTDLLNFLIPTEANLLGANAILQKDLIAIHFPRRGRRMGFVATTRDRRALPPMAMAQAGRQGPHRDAGPPRARDAGSASSCRRLCANRAALEDSRAHPAHEKCAARAPDDLRLPDSRRHDSLPARLGGVAEACEVCARARNRRFHAAESRLSLLDYAD